MDIPVSPLVNGFDRVLLNEALKRFPERATYNALHPDLKGYWQFFGRIDVGEGFFFHAPAPIGATRGAINGPPSPLTT